MSRMGDRFVAALLESSAHSSSSSGGSSNVINVSLACKAVALDIIGITVLGCEFHSLENTLQKSPTAQSLEFFLSELTRRQFGNPLSMQNFFYSIPCESNTKFKEAKQAVVGTLSQLVRDKQRELGAAPPPVEKQEEQHHDMLRSVALSTTLLISSISFEFIYIGQHSAPVFCPLTLCTPLCSYSLRDC